MISPLYRLLANTLQAFLNCQTRNPVNQEWANRHETTIDQLCKDFLPSGSGIDCGTKFDWDQSTPEKLVFLTSYHHMNDGGYYDGWTEHKVIVTPSLCSDFDLKVTGRDRNEIKDYLAEVFDSALSEPIDRDENGFFSPTARECAKRFQEGIAKGEIV
jgi:hypothetical protein